jgi:hypothetical protein
MRSRRRNSEDIVLGIYVLGENKVFPDMNTRSLV